MLEIFEISDPRARERMSRLSRRLEELGSRADDPSRERTRKVFGAPLTPAEVARRIVGDVRERGDAAVFEYARKLDRFELSAANVRVAAAEIEAARRAADPELMDAIRAAAGNIRAYQRRTLPRDIPLKGKLGLRTGAVYTPVERVGVLVPAGSAPLVSTLLMCAVPAQVAGVREIAVATPPGPDGSIAPAILAAAAEIGLGEIYRVGGCQAVAALAFGTVSIRKADMIVGPGNVFVMLAKAEVSSVVRMDAPAGPSEILVIADDSARPELVAADMLSQAEHDALASAVLATTSGELAAAVREQIERQLAGLSRRETARRSIDGCGLAVVCRSLDECVEAANELAPEHLELMVRQPQELLPKIRHAGAVFIGESTPEAVGDYLAGPSHTLPTGGNARMWSGLAAESFMKRISLIESSPEWLSSEGARIVTLASAEGLDAHAVSVRRRCEP